MDLVTMMKEVKRFDCKYENAGKYTSRFLLTSYVGLLLRSTAVGSTSWSTVEGTVRVL